MSDPTGSTRRRTKVVTDYSGYNPPFDVGPIIEKMLDFVPAKYLNGLNEVVLGSSTGLSRKGRRSKTYSRKRKVKIADALGLYHGEWQGKPAWIQIFVDNTLRRWEKGWWLRFSACRDQLLSDVLFHEIGHHIHATLRPEFREKEDIADEWQRTLSRSYFRRRHPIFLFFFRLLSPALRALAGKYLKDDASHSRSAH